LVGDVYDFCHFALKLARDDLRARFSTQINQEYDLNGKFTLQRVTLDRVADEPGCFRVAICSVVLATNQSVLQLRQD